MALNLLDAKILFELDRNSRQSITELARSLGNSRERIAYRIKTLEERGVIRGYTCSVNPYQFGLSIYKTALQLENNKARVQKLLGFLDKHPRVYWYAECNGRFDVSFALFGKSLVDFIDVQEQILSRFSDIITGVSVYSIVEAYFFYRRYLGGAGVDFHVLGGEPDHFSLSREDFDLLKILAQNSRLTAVEIAKLTGATPAVIRDKIAKLEERKIITGYRLDIDLASINRKVFKAQIFLRNYDMHGQEALREFCKMTPEVSLLVEQIGDCKYEMEVEVKDFDDYNRIIDDMREKFPKTIRRIDTLIIRRERYKSMPLDLVS